MWAGQATALDVLKHVSRNMPPCFRVPVKPWEVFLVDSMTGHIPVKIESWNHPIFHSLVRFEVGFQNVWYGAEQKKKPRNFVEFSWPLVNGGFASTSIHAFLQTHMPWNDQQDQDPGSWRIVNSRPWNFAMATRQLVIFCSQGCERQLRVQEGNKDKEVLLCAVWVVSIPKFFVPKWEFSPQFFHLQSAFGKKNICLTKTDTFNYNWISLCGLKASFLLHKKPSLEEVFATFDINSFKVRSDCDGGGENFQGWCSCPRVRSKHTCFFDISYHFLNKRHFPQFLVLGERTSTSIQAFVKHFEEYICCLGTGDIKRNNTMSNLFIILEYEFTDESLTERSGSLRHSSPNGDVERFQDMVQKF